MMNYRDRIRHILTRHEQGSIHAAQGYTRSSGKVGVCIATYGPGATNLVTGLADAFMDNTPIVCITGQVDSKLLGTDAFQEVDILDITLPLTKWNIQINKVKDLDKKKRIIKIKYKIRKTFKSNDTSTVRHGTPERPRLSLFRSHKEIYSQLIDDISVKSLVSASSLDKGLIKKSVNKKEQALIVGKELGKKSLMAGIKKVVLDRNGYSYHGRIKYLAESAKYSGLEF